jgi:hypothetical protein
MKHWQFIFLSSTLGVSLLAFGSAWSPRPMNRAELGATGASAPCTGDVTLAGTMGTCDTPCASTSIPYEITSWTDGGTKDRVAVAVATCADKDDPKNPCILQTGTKVTTSCVH